MARGGADTDGSDPDIGLDDRLTAAWMAAIVLVTLTVWIAFKDGAVKYSIYSLPVTLTAAYLVIHRGQLRVNRPGAVSLLLYLMLATLSMVANSWYDFYAIRDVAIVGGYLALFVLWFRAPPSTADLALLALALGMLVEAATEGLGKEVDLFGSNGILESTLAFPLGAVTLYFLHARQWGRALVACLLLFLAFKRIAFLGVGLAIGFDLVISRFLRVGAARALALMGVVTLSLLALFSAQLFEWVSETLNLESTSANSISLGRYDIATRLWRHLMSSPMGVWLIGSGPGAADAVVAATNPDLNNPHNDWLKILYDYGVVGFVVLHTVLYRNLTENRLGVMLYIYGAAVMMTDNIFIYMFYHPFVLLMLCTARR